MSDFLNGIVKESGNKYASLVNDGLPTSDVGVLIDTGCHILNALVSGDVYGGIPDNKIMALAGEQATGKTYITMGIVSKFLKDHPEAVVLYFDSEQAVTTEMFKNRGVDPKRVAVFPVMTIEEFRKQIVTIVDKYLEMPENKRKKMMIVLDSLGMLSTSKEMNDVAEGKNVRDMTRAQVIKGTFRVLTLKLGKAKIPMIMTNHTYDVVGAYVPTKELGGGSGLKYAASTIVTLSKKKDKQDDEVVGNIITCKLYKSRLTKENKIVQVQLNFDSGLNRYYGLVDLALDYGIFKKNSTKIELPDGTKAFEKHINEEPEKYFTQEILKQIDERVQEDFKYG